MRIKSITSTTIAFLAVGLVSACDPSVHSIDFGDDTSRWANDGECDDPRFVGIGAHANNLAQDIGRDASDCRRLCELDAVRLLQAE